MGRYYEGDINGKFVFGLQSSTAADQFGVTGVPPNYLDYWFDESNIPDIKEGLKQLEEQMPRNVVDALQAYYDLHPDENAAPLTFEDFYYKSDQGPFPRENAEHKADYKLGRKILHCVETTGECSFTAEL